MARYIDVEKLELKGISVFDENLDVFVLLSDVREAIQMTPTADVVPKSGVIYDHHGQVACYTFGCTEADKVRKEAVTKTLSDIKRQIHEKAIYPHNAGIKPYISVREVDAIIEKEISHTKGGG